jgi:hypothetical protein
MPNDAAQAPSRSFNLAFLQKKDNSECKFFMIMTPFLFNGDTFIIPKTQNFTILIKELRHDNSYAAKVIRPYLLFAPLRSIVA